jgi:hypothetical protein
MLVAQIRSDQVNHNLGELKTLLPMTGQNYVYDLRCRAYKWQNKIIVEHESCFMVDSLIAA